MQDENAKKDCSFDENGMKTYSCIRSLTTYSYFWPLNDNFSILFIFQQELADTFHQPVALDSYKVIKVINFV